MAHPVRSRDAWQWPEWLAFANRLGVDLHPQTRKITITLEYQGLVTVDSSYLPIEHKPEESEPL